jgi:hypothetical protein
VELEVFEWFVLAAASLALLISMWRRHIRPASSRGLFLAIGLNVTGSLLNQTHHLLASLIVFSASGLVLLYVVVAMCMEWREKAKHKVG